MKRNRARLQLLIAALALGGAMLACGLGSAEPTSAPTKAVVDTPSPTKEAATETPTPEPTDTPTPQPEGVDVQDATFALDLDDEGRALDPVSDFAPDEKIYLVLTLKGRPTGTMTGHFYRGDTSLGEADVALDDINSGVVFSIGENTFVNFWMAPDPGSASRISDDYRIEVFYEDELVGSYPFSIVPPSDAIPSEVQDVTLARGVDSDYNPMDPSTTFGPDEDVYIVARGDAGLHSWFQVEWYVDGELDEAGTRSITAEENASGAGLYFSYVPEGGWPLGEHQVVLIMDDEEMGRYDFTIEEPPLVSLVSFEDPAGVFALSYPSSFDQVDEDLTEGYSYMFLDSDGTGAINAFFTSLGDEPFSDDAWQAFVGSYDLAGMPGFGDDAVELDRQLGQPGVHALFLEAESQESGLHGLVWVEEVDGSLAVAVFATPIELWSEQEEIMFDSLDSFTWSPEAVQAVVPPPIEPTPVPTPTLPPPPPTPTPVPAANPYAPPPGKASLVIFNNSDLEINFTVANQENKLAPHTEKVVLLDPGHHTYTFHIPGFEVENHEGDVAADRIYGWLFDGASFTPAWVDITQ
jgi:hypothetical protein